MPLDALSTICIYIIPFFLSHSYMKNLIEFSSELGRIQLSHKTSTIGMQLYVCNDDDANRNILFRSVCVYRIEIVKMDELERIPAWCNAAAEWNGKNGIKRLYILFSLTTSHSHVITWNIFYCIFNKPYAPWNMKRTFAAWMGFPLFHVGIFITKPLSLNFMWK